MRAASRDRAVLVCGAAGELGSAVANRLAREGTALVLVDVDEPSLERVAGQASDWKTPVAQVVADLTTENGRLRLATALSELTGAIPSVLVSHARIETRAPFLSVEPRDYRRQMDASVEAAFFAGQQLACQWIESDSAGVVVHIASIAGTVHFPERSACATAMAALRGLTGAMAYELAPHGIRVNAVAPGCLETAVNGIERTSVPAGRLGSADEVAGVISFLVSERSSYITGQTITVDGGYSLQ